MEFRDDANLRVLVESAPIGICILDAQTFVAELLNDKFLEIAGKPRQAILDKWYWEPFAEARAYYEEAMTGVVSSGKAYFADEVKLMLVRHGAEEDIYVTFVYAPVFGDGGKVDKLAVWVLENTTQVREREKLAIGKVAAERELEKLKAQSAQGNLQQILDMLPASVVVIRGYDLVVESINTANLNYWKKTRQEVVGRPFLDILPDLADQPFAGQLRKVMDTGEMIDVKESPVLFTMEDGSIRETYVDYTYQPLLDISGKSTGVLVMSFEITDRVHSKNLLEKYTAELTLANAKLSSLNEELAFSEARFKFLIQEAPVAIGVLAGRDLVVESANAMILEVWGKSQSIIGMKLEDALPELKGQPFLGILDEVFTSGTAFHASEIRAMLEHKGELREFYFNAVYQPISGPSGSTSDILVVAVDVTAQVHSRRKVEQAELTLRHALEAGNVGTWYINAETREMVASDRLKELFGYYPEDKMELSHAIEQIDEEFRQLVIDAIERSINEGGNYDVSYRLSGYRDKKVRWVRALGNITRDDLGGYTAFTGVIMDITDQKQDELRKNDFIGMVSHELKTPLTSLNGHLQFMQRKAQKGQELAGQAFDQPLKQVRQMTDMIAGFLNVSRLDSGKIHIEKSSFDLSGLVRETEQEQVELYGSHQLVFSVMEPIFVSADRGKVAQVINNLVSNAAKYSPSGTAIELSCRKMGNFARVSVRDKGMGIAEKDLEKLFERYYRVENNSNVSGFGIGLYLSHEIVERHGGRIWAESEMGAGSAFHFELPVD